MNADARMPLSAPSLSIDPAHICPSCSRWWDPRYPCTYCLYSDERAHWRYNDDNLPFLSKEMIRDKANDF